MSEVPEQPLSPVEALNMQIKSELEAAAEHLRARFIGSAFAAATGYLGLQLDAMADLEERDFPSHEPLELYVIDNLYGLPFEPGEDGELQPTRALTLRLQSDIAEQETDPDFVQDYMLVHVPIPDDVVLTTDFDIESLEEPDRIGVEYMRNGLLSSYVLDRWGLKPYSNGSEDQIVAEDILDEFNDDLMKRVDTSLPVITGLFEHFNNWSAQVQRTLYPPDDNISLN